MKKQTFHEAQDFCQKHGGQIVKINDPTVKAFIGIIYQIEYGPNYIWLNALQTSKNSGIFKWLDDNSTVTDVHGYAGADSNSECVAVFLFWSRTGIFHEICSGSNAVVCEKRRIIGTLDNGTSTNQHINQPTSNFSALLPALKNVWMESEIDRSVEYLLDKTKRSFEDGQHFCRQRGGRIVQITNPTEQNYIHHKYLDNGGPFWIWLNALQTFKNPQIFKWLDDNSTVTNIDWDLQYHQPYDLPNECVALTLLSLTNMWWAEPCSGINAVVCEKRITSEPHNGTLPSETVRVLDKYQFTNLTSQTCSTQQGIKWEMMMYLIIGSTAAISIVLFVIYVMAFKTVEQRVDHSELLPMQ